MASDQPKSNIAANDHRAYMEFALEKARLSPPGPDKFCVGACLVDADANRVISTGFSLELPRDSGDDPGSTHAEQCCFIKVAREHHIPEDSIGKVLPKNTVLYTTMEPCNERLSGSRSCVERILRLKGAIKTIYVGIREPEVFVKGSSGAGVKALENAGVAVDVIDELRDRITEVALAGHEGRRDATL